MASLIGWLEADNLAGQLLRAVRQGFYFGIETRVPYAIGEPVIDAICNYSSSVHLLGAHLFAVNLVRPKMFNKKSRPILGQVLYRLFYFCHGPPIL